MQRRPDDLPPRQLPSWMFPWKAATTSLECEQPETTQEKEKNNLEVLGGFTIQPLNKRNTQHKFFFFLFLILFYGNDFCNLARIMCFILLTVQILFAVKLSSWMPSLSVLTLRNPRTYHKEDIRLQDTLRYTDMSLVERWSYGGHVAGEVKRFSALSRTAEGCRPAVCLARKVVWLIHFFCLIVFAQMPVLC